MSAVRGTPHCRERPVSSTIGRRSLTARTLPLLVALALILSVSQAAVAQTFTVLHRFRGYPKDGATPLGGLLMDASGNLYGTTLEGGRYSGCLGLLGCGTVFKLDTNGVETVLHNFNGADGAGSSATLTMDANGDLYGTTAVGGGNGCQTGASVGCGLLFKLNGGKETVLYRFAGGADGAWPWAGVIMDASGALYGTTNSGGNAAEGVAFKLVGTKETVLHSFCSWPNCEDGGYLTAGSLIMDSSGNLYGTAAYGGDVNCDYPSGCGVVFKLTGKKETVLHSFKGPPDGANPWAAVFMDVGGNLYGTTADAGDGSNGGTVFEVRQGGKERVLHTFGVGSKTDGVDPQSAVVLDATGNLYGTTLYDSGRGAGTVFEITADGKERILHIFCTTDCLDGADPIGDLVIDAKGNLYGTASGGGVSANGTIFMITPPPSSTGPEPSNGVDMREVGGGVRLR